jgi:hypothetical protein
VYASFSPGIPVAIPGSCVFAAGASSRNDSVSNEGVDE